MTGDKKDTKPLSDPAAPALGEPAREQVAVDRETLNASISTFAEKNGEHYARAFEKIHDSSSGFALVFNPMAALFGPLWAAARGAWGFFWTFLLLEIIAFVQIGRGLWGELGADALGQAERQAERANSFLERAAAATAAGEDPSRFERLADNLMQAAERSRDIAAAAAADAQGILIMGLVLLVGLRIIEGLYADIMYEKQYSAWRVSPKTVASGFSLGGLSMGAILTLIVAPLTVYKFTVAEPFEGLSRFPADPDLYSDVARWLEGQIDAAAVAGAGAFDGVVSGIRAILDALTVALVGTPWPVVMTVIIFIAWRLAGPRVAIFTTAAIAYLAFLGFWEISMETVALVGAAVVICLAIGIPAGVWFGKSQRAYRFAEPVLDLMQTLPAFVYLIPIIAFFGTGNPPGVLATIIFGMPPVVRLTALGIRGVPATIKEGAFAFGASKWQVLKDVELPLARPSIMTGVNQTILMCLSMVVIISLIGGGGLGKSILEALQFAAKGPGILGGLAILFCAMVIDRIIQGAFRSK